MKGVNIFLADGFEDIEALATYDVLRRGEIDVNLISLSDDPFVVSSHGITIGVEQSINDIDLSAKGTERKDIMIFPGGMPGTRNLAGCKPLIEAMKEHYDAGGSLAAICAAPGLVLSKLEERLEGVKFTCYDGFEDATSAFGAEFIPKPAIRCDRIITGRSAGHAVTFALEILEFLTEDATALEVNRSLHLDTI